MGWLLLVISLAYGIRGSFGLLCAAVTLYILGFRRSTDTTANDGQRIILGSISFAVIAFSVYLDELGNSIFSGLSAPDLSPLTPVVLMGSVCIVFLLIYGRANSVRAFSSTDLPVLALFLATLTLFDALDKSLLALLLLFGGWCLIMQRAMGKPATGISRTQTFGIQLHNRLKLAFGNRIVPVSILVLILFALVNDLSSTYANEMQFSISPLLAPVLIPILSLVSVFLTFTGIASLFVLVYPYIPSRVGYLKATFFALFLFLIFLFGIATDDRLIAALPTMLVGRILYYFSVPLLIGVYFDIDEYMQKENKRRAKAGTDTERISFQTASSLYLRNLQGVTSTLAGIISLVVPSLYAFLSSQPVLGTYFNLLEKLILLPL
jgi:hypothetical protein